MTTRRISPFSMPLVLALVLAGLFAMGCGGHGEATQLIVVVDTDMAIPSGLDGVDFAIVGAGGMRVTAHSAIASSAALPLTLALEPAGDGGNVDIQITGTLLDAAVVEQHVSTSFVRGERRLVRVFLSSDCVGVTCSDTAQTCRAAICVDAAVPASSLPRFAGEPGRLDAGMPSTDAGTDSGVDAGTCDCAPGEACVDGVCEGDLAVRVNCGEHFTCITRRSGVVSCLGANEAGQLGNGATSAEPQLTPTDVVGFGAGAPMRVGTMSAGFDFACLLTEGGEVFCWGANEVGELGDGTLSSRSTPQRVRGMDVIQAVSCGSNHTCVVTNAGKVSCFGGNAQGQLGDGTTAAHNTPAPIGMLPDGTAVDATAIAAGQDFSCATVRSGGVVCWGQGDSGQNGSTTFMSTNAPESVGGLAGFAPTAVVAGFTNACVPTDAGLVRCWGAANFGRLGDNGASGGADQPSAVPLPSLASVAHIAAGPDAAHTCALTESGEVRCWGENGVGQIGDESTGDFAAQSVAIPLPSATVDLDTGGLHTCAVLDNGRVYCWGYNDAGQLGDGTLEQRNAPVEATAFF